jgi:mannose-1-phosphate guanylyltransferase
VKAFILAAGHGTRLLPLTKEKPKCLVEIQGSPMLALWLRWCKLSGISEVVINLHAHAQMVQQFIDDNDFGVKVNVSPEPVLLGSAGTLKKNRDFVVGESEFAILYADVLTNMDFAPLVALHRQQHATATIGLYRVPNPKSCGIVELDADNRVISFEEKPENPRSDLAFSGIMVASPAMLDSVPDLPVADIGFHTLPGLLGTLYGCQLGAGEYLVDIGTLEKYEAAQIQWPGLNDAKIEV